MQTTDKAGVTINFPLVLHEQQRVKVDVAIKANAWPAEMSVIGSDTHMDGLNTPVITILLQQFVAVEELRGGVRRSYAHHDRVLQN